MVSDISKRILNIRGMNVILDYSLAELYGVETRTLKQSVRRNIKRFPNDFMFMLNDKEIREVVSQNVIPFYSKYGGHYPFAFTEHRVAMLSSILNSDKAIAVNIAIIRAFVDLRIAISSNSVILQRIEELEEEYSDHDDKILLILKIIKKLIDEKPSSKRKIGYRLN